MGHTTTIGIDASRAERRDELADANLFAAHMWSA
jgi:hypothetical protein